MLSGARSLINILGVLRRPQTTADRDPELLSRLDRPWVALLGSPILSSVRLASTTPWGDKVFLVLLRPLTRQSIATLPTGLRPIAMRRLADEYHGDTLGLFDSTGGTCCSRPAEINAGSDWMTSGPGLNTLILVVPDGVAKVTVLSSLKPASKHPGRETAVVHDNVAAFLPPYAVENLGVNRIIWRAPNGRVIKRRGRRSS
ncbi:MAG: hypothetical protein ABI323_01935 [Solirubrobacteraceae bacterium]